MTLIICQSIHVTDRMPISGYVFEKSLRPLTQLCPTYLVLIPQRSYSLRSDGRITSRSHRNIYSKMPLTFCHGTFIVVDTFGLGWREQSAAVGRKCPWLGSRVGFLHAHIHCRPYETLYPARGPAHLLLCWRSLLLILCALSSVPIVDHKVIRSKDL